MSDAPQPSEVVAARVGRARRVQGITTQRLAERCRELGATWLTRDVVQNIESGRRGVSVDDVWALAAALNTPPLVLMLPLGESGVRVAVTPSITAYPQVALEWAEGESPLPESDGISWRAGAGQPWPDEDTPTWNEASAPLWFYRRLRQLQNALGEAHDKQPVLDELRAHIEFGDRIGIDEHEELENLNRLHGEEGTDQ